MVIQTIPPALHPLPRHHPYPCFRGLFLFCLYHAAHLLSSWLLGPVLFCFPALWLLAPRAAAFPPGARLPFLPRGSPTPRCALALCSRGSRARRIRGTFEAAGTSWDPGSRANSAWGWDRCLHSPAGCTPARGSVAAMGCSSSALNKAGDSGRLRSGEQRTRPHPLPGLGIQVGLLSRGPRGATRAHPAQQRAGSSLRMDVKP